MIYSLLKPFLFAMDAERSHHLIFSLAKRFPCFLPKVEIKQPVEIAGLLFPNAVGVAAGLDKNGEYLDVLSRIGFGHIEVGTVTPRPQAGNPKPRLFRLKEDRALINRMGFNNYGVDQLLKNVSASKFEGILGINVGKNADTPMDKAIDDYLICMEKAYEAASYIAVNISSPNTQNLRELQTGKYLSDLLSAVKAKQAELAERHGYKPVFVKVAPDLDEVQIAQMCESFLTHHIDGVIATNTWLKRDGVKSPLKTEKGGLSGKPIHEQSVWVVSEFAKHLKGEVPLIGIGGIDSVESAEDMFNAGAKAIQIYTGLIYQGPSVVQHIGRIQCVL